VCVCVCVCVCVFVCALMVVRTVKQVHRIGRTGRAGTTGEAFTFFTATNAKSTGKELLRILSENGQTIPPEFAAVPPPLALDSPRYVRPPPLSFAPSSATRHQPV
jgi:superfamily II DNA/RNA helicase